MPGIASAATAVVIGHVAGGTTRIRVGAGGIMLPNHAPLVIAEQFGTLDALCILAASISASAARPAPTC
jgi:alkanesulfonate monooxygenase SsuD/methylene tetrahydromethanopterin reductase-like flavin-dependent oxidoreductase (luciferase family)